MVSEFLHHWADIAQCWCREVNYSHSSRHFFCISNGSTCKEIDPQYFFKSILLILTGLFFKAWRIFSTDVPFSIVVIIFKSLIHKCTKIVLNAFRDEEGFHLSKKRWNLGPLRTVQSPVPWIPRPCGQADAHQVRGNGRWNTCPPLEGLHASFIIHHSSFITHNS